MVDIRVHTKGHHPLTNQIYYSFGQQRRPSSSSDGQHCGQQQSLAVAIIVLSGQRPPNASATSPPAAPIFCRIATSTTAAQPSDAVVRQPFAIASHIATGTASTDRFVGSPHRWLTADAFGRSYVRLCLRLRRIVVDETGRIASGTLAAIPHRVVAHATDQDGISNAEGHTERIARQ